MTDSSFAAYSISLAPYLSGNGLWIVAIILGILMVLSLFIYRRGLLIRPLMAAAFVFLLLNIGLIEQKREPVKDVVVIVKDRSPSQTIGQRTERTDSAMQSLRENIGSQASLDLRVVEAPSGARVNINETHLFTALDTILADVPESRRAGVIFLTDGQVHDVPQNTEKLREYGPLHVLLTGEKDETDRRLSIINAPAYGIVGQEANITFKVEEPESGSDRINTRNGQYARLTIRENNQAPRHKMVPLNEEQSIKVQLDRAGQNIIELETETIEGELTAANNRTPVIINGVRDRLKVLLVSGQPHAGGRTWRNIMTSDPGVDLVHFTILREPDKLDFTPQNELSLIAFPFRELFEVKLYDFDLIIFDRYRLNRILPLHYFENISRYVREGGALLEVSGPSYATQDSLFTTALKDILPASPAGNVMTRKFTPSLTDTGDIHPVTTGLKPSGTEAPSWGAWFRQIGVATNDGDVLMNGINNTPLLLLNRIGEGRVAQFSSDQIWLWARGYEGGGPQAELLRRLIHWLMKEPQLEENALTTNVKGNEIEITRRTLTEEPVTAEIETPTGKKETRELSLHDKGILKGHYHADSPGIYKISDSSQSRFVIVGEAAPPELMNLHTTAKPMEKAVRESKGTTKWLIDNPSLRVRPLTADRKYNLQSNIALRSNNAFEIKGVQEKPLLPPWAALSIMVAVLLGGWLFESRNKKTS